MADMVWHYSHLRFLEAINECGELIPQAEAQVYGNTFVANRQTRNFSFVPLLWFSSNQQSEVMAAQVGHNLNGAIRFGLPASDQRLLNWKETCKAGGLNRMQRRTREKVAKAAKKHGADVNNWFTTLVAIPLTQLYLQIWFDGKWSDPHGHRV